MNYLGWIQFAASHLLVSDPFTTAPTTADFLHPGLVISTLLVRLGATPDAAYLLWKPAAVIVSSPALPAPVIIPTTRVGSS